MRRGNIGLALRTNFWEEIEAVDTAFNFDDTGRLTLDGFSTITAPVAVFCGCGEVLSDARFSQCDTCKFLSVADEQERLKWKSMPLFYRQADLRYRNRLARIDDWLQDQTAVATASNPRCASALARIGARANRCRRNAMAMHRSELSLENRAHRSALKLANAVYSFVSYRLEHRPVSFYRGENNRAARLTEAAVIDIRANYAPVAGSSSYAFAEKYGVTPLTVMQAVYGSTWAHVDGHVLKESPIYPAGTTAVFRKRGPSKMFGGHSDPELERIIASGATIRL